MKVSYFKKRMSTVFLLLQNWRQLTSKELCSTNWVNYLRKSACILWDLAEELEWDMAKGIE